MKKMALLLTSLLVSGTLAAAESFDITARQTVDMPANVVQVLRGEMVNLLRNLQMAQSLSAEGKYFEAADHVEKTMGISAMGGHAGGVRPGMHMPAEMRTLAQGLHRSASEWSQVLRGGDRKQAETAAARVIGNCVACHTSFQIRRLQ